MNTERLHKILTELQREFITKNSFHQLQIVSDNLTNQINDPQEPEYQQNLVDALKELYKILSNSAYNNFSPGWRQIVDEIGGKNMFGLELKSSVEEIFNRNQITPAIALEDITVILTKVEELRTAIDEIISGFIKLKIGREDLLPGQCEFGYSIPRNAVDNKLSSLTKEISELNFILGTISEAVIGKKENFDVKTISSSDFLFYVIISLQVAVVLSNAVEKIISNYKTILEIKILRNQLKEKGVPESATQEIETHANSKMGEVIRTIANEVIAEHYKSKDEGRKHEMENAIVIALNKIANRIDRGFNVEIRVEPLPPATEKNKDDSSYEVKLSSINKIQTQSKTLEYINTSGHPILKLNEAIPPRPKK